MVLPIVDLTKPLSMHANWDWPDASPPDAIGNGLIDEADLKFGRQPSGKGRQERLSIVGQLELQSSHIYYMVLSQCCDLAVRDGRRPPWFIVSPLRTPSQELDNEKRALLELNSPEHKINQFFIGSREGLPELFVDFSVLVSLQRQQYDTVYKRRVARLTDLERIDLKRKLSVFFGRFTDEETTQGVPATAIAQAEERLRLHNERFPGLHGNPGNP